MEQKKGETLLEVFAARPKRFWLLDRGLRRCGGGPKTKILEIGCAYGDASFYMANRYGCQVTGVDISEDTLAVAQDRWEKEKGPANLRFCKQDAEALDLEKESFDLIVSEAAFSPIPQKEKVARNDFQVLRPGGRVLLNDFAIQYKVEQAKREELAFIPCFAGVSTMEDYQQIFLQQGFGVEYAKEEYGELISLTSWICRSYGISQDKIGGYFSRYLRENSKAPQPAACTLPKDSRESFLSKAKMTYCQMIFCK